MPNYRYQARNVEGHDVTGLVLADDQRLALRDLRRRGLTPFVLAVEAARPNRPTCQSREVGAPSSRKSSRRFTSP